MKVLLLIIPMLVFAIVLDANNDIASGSANITHEFPYPINGWEPVIAMLAIGLLAARYRDRRSWTLPAVFVLLFAAGLSLGMLNAGPFPWPLELLILFSVAVSVLLVVSGRCLPLSIAAPLIAVFGLIHGYAHGIQISSEVSAVRYSRELVTATAVLLLIGMATGTGVRLAVCHWLRLSLPAPKETPP